MTHLNYSKDMHDFSQTGEQAVILEYFGDYKGTFLDIGANDGKTFSNTHALALLGWTGVCIEPTESAYGKLCDLYKDTPQIHTFNICIGAATQEVDFYESADTLVATTKAEEITKWERNCGMVFQKMKKQMLSFSDFVDLCYYKTFDFINIDTEGVDFEILQQIFLGNVQMVCIEVNQEHRVRYIEYFSRNGMRLIKDTDINLIFAK